MSDEQSWLRANKVHRRSLDGSPSDPFPFEISHKTRIYIVQVMCMMAGRDEDRIRHDSFLFFDCRSGFRVSLGEMIKMQDVVDLIY